jgi:aminoglycoside phosphotransferase (APT) family kinase protein
MSEVADVAEILASEPLGAWIAEHVDGAVPPFALRLIAGGRSNLTYRLTDASGRRLVLRRPPRGHVLPSAHDVGREHRIVSALAATPVPVPRALAVCEDTGVLGARFSVMEFVDGAVLRDEASVEACFAPAERALLSDALVDALAALHAVDPDAVGLGDLGRRDGYVERQLRRWLRQFEAVKSRELPAIDEVHARLAAQMPAQLRSSIVHGDFRLDNCLLAPDCSVAAVLDWELCTLGDPLADLGMLMVYWARPGDPVPNRLTGLATTLPGFPDRPRLVERYAAATGADVSQLDFYVALGYWKLACIAEGIYARYRAGVMGDDGASAEQFAAHAIELSRAALLTTELIGA